MDLIEKKIDNDTTGSTKGIFPISRVYKICMYR